MPGSRAIRPSFTKEEARVLTSLLETALDGGDEMEEMRRATGYHGLAKLKRAAGWS